VIPSQPIERNLSQTRTARFQAIQIKRNRHPSVEESSELSKMKNTAKKKMKKIGFFSPFSLPNSLIECSTATIRNAKTTSLNLTAQPTRGIRNVKRIRSVLNIA
jgi:hypothetical protein